MLDLTGLECSGWKLCRVEVQTGIRGKKERQTHGVQVLGSFCARSLSYTGVEVGVGQGLRSGRTGVTVLMGSEGRWGLGCRGIWVVDDGRMQSGIRV